MTPDDAQELEQPDPFGCADEPIHVPGAIQPHGALLAVTEPELRLAVVSANAAAVLGRGDIEGGSGAGRPLAELLGPGPVEALRAVLDGAGSGDVAELNPHPLEVPGRDGSLHTFDAILHRSGGLLVIELEPVDGAGPAAWYRPLRPALARLNRAPSVADLTDTVADVVQRLTGFDRVMVYRFDPQWNGEVVAEVRRPDLEPFLGLRYPATDIPAQARALYERNWLRLIPDSDYQPVPLVPDRSPVDGRPLDLSDAVLRSVSPVHLEYLHNMGVAASMSASLIRDGRLWGLVACHHYSGPHLPRYQVRAAVEFLAQAASVLLEAKERAGAEADRQAVEHVETALLQALADRTSRPIDALTESSVTITELTRAAGAAVRIGQELRLVGATPDAATVSEIADVAWQDGRSSFVTDGLAVSHPQWEPVKDVASGVLGIRLGTRSDQYLFWFRPERLRSVEWGGDPAASKLVEDERGMRLSPRQSFERYTELVRLHSLPWADHEVEAAIRLGAHVSQSLVGLAAERDEVWTALQRTLLAEQLPTIPGFTFGVRYFPGGRTPVGGDWYDVIHLPNGHTAIAVGDVAGHGLAAAAASAQFRHGMRAYLLAEQSPAAALRRLNELAHWLLPSDLVTVFVADVDPATRTMRVAGAGHVPALVIDDAGARFVRGPRGPALGLTTEPGYHDEEVVLAPDSTVLLFTDGLIEERGRPLDDGLNRLLDEARAMGGDRDPERMCEHITAAFGAAGRHDDVTLVAFRLSTAERAAG